MCQYSRIMSTCLKSQDHSGSVYIKENLLWEVGAMTRASIKHCTIQVVDTSGMLSMLALFWTSWGHSRSVTRTYAPVMFRSSSLTTRVVAPTMVHTCSQNLTSVSWSPQNRITLSLKNVVLRLPDAGTWNIWVIFLIPLLYNLY